MRRRMILVSFLSLGHKRPDLLRACIGVLAAVAEMRLRPMAPLLYPQGARVTA